MLKSKTGSKGRGVPWPDLSGDVLMRRFYVKLGNICSVRELITQYVTYFCQ